MYTKRIAKRLEELLMKKQFVEAYNELFHPNAISIDPIQDNIPNQSGLNELIEREVLLLNKIEVTNVEMSSPLISGTDFCVSIAMDLKSGNEITQLQELAVYRTDGEKIVSQQFFISKYP